MFDLNHWQEIFSIIRKNLLRTILTGISVSWGIFVLIILLGSGKGLQNSAIHSFSGDAQNSIYIYPGRSSKAYQGMAPGKKTQFRDRDYTETIRLNEVVIEGTSRVTPGRKMFNYGTKTSEYELMSATQNDLILENINISEGRFINEFDLKKWRKVAVIGPKVKEYFFDNNSPLGSYILSEGTAFQVVGVFHDPAQQDDYRIYIPTTTAQILYNSNNKINLVGITIDKINLEQNKELEKQLREQFSDRHKFDPEDTRALYIRSNWENFMQVQNVFTGIRIFIWIIGICSMIAAIVGITNIMFITVKERTKEFGVRKAIGATPVSITMIVLSEALVITSFFGYAGLFAGTFILEMVSSMLPDTSMFMKNPTIDLRTAISATILLIIAGTLAGYFPARKASRIKPIVALRDE